jgi:hypothetical protein
VKMMRIYRRDKKSLIKTWEDIPYRIGAIVDFDDAKEYVWTTVRDVPRLRTSIQS